MLSSFGLDTSALGALSRDVRWVSSPEFCSRPSATGLWEGQIGGLRIGQMWWIEKVVGAGSKRWAGPEVGNVRGSG
ncbi:hypothetical protein U1Q18_027557 [Sarracenia purpurea var. burkii]